MLKASAVILVYTFKAWQPETDHAAAVSFPSLKGCYTCNLWELSSQPHAPLQNVWYSSVVIIISPPPELHQFSNGEFVHNTQTKSRKTPFIVTAGQRHVILPSGVSHHRSCAFLEVQVQVHIVRAKPSGRGSSS